VISDEVFHRLEQELDVEAMRTGLGDVRLSEAQVDGGGHLSL